MDVSFRLKKWAGWVAAGEAELTAEQLTGSLAATEKPDVAVIPAMLRRRLNFLGRACAAQVLQMVTDTDQVPLVYCTRHGDIERTLSVLLELADEQPVSPMQFSLAVHNAITGVLSIQLKNPSAISTLVSDNGGVVPVLLEAAGLLTENRAETVLCLIADVQLPEIYRDEDTESDFSFAVSFLMSKSEGEPFSLSFDAMGESRQTELNCMPIELIQFLDSAESRMLIQENGCLWQLERT